MNNHSWQRLRLVTIQLEDILTLTPLQRLYILLIEIHYLRIFLLRKCMVSLTNIFMPYKIGDFNSEKPSEVS